MAKCTGVRCPMQYGYKVEKCNHTDCPCRTEPITNADRIRAMSDEELADLFYRIVDAQESCTLICGNLDECKRNNEPYLVCEKHYLEWLKQPAE